MIYRFAPDARRELIEATHWYLAEGGSLLAHMPRLGTPTYPSVRAWPLKRFPYTVLYRLESDGILVIAVAHQSREPGYWKQRR